jgi:hypothetical protein
MLCVLAGFRADSGAKSPRAQCGNGLRNANSLARVAIESAAGKAQNGRLRGSCIELAGLSLSIQNHSIDLAQELRVR